jgi:hypothetical protein
LLAFLSSDAQSALHRKSPMSRRRRFRKQRENPLNQLVSILIDTDALYRICARHSNDAAGDAHILSVAGETRPATGSTPEVPRGLRGKPRSVWRGSGDRVPLVHARPNDFRTEQKVAIEEVLRGELHYQDF